MTRTRWLISGLWLLAFWLVAAVVLAPQMQQRLTSRAGEVTAALPTGYAPVEVSFDGLQAHLRGRVRRESQRAEILFAMRDQVRVSGLGANLNPVQAVVDETEIVPYPPGWLMIAANGPRGQLLGRAATEYEGRDLGTQLSQRWSEKGGYLDNRIGSAPDQHDEAGNVSALLSKSPLPRAEEAGGDSAQIQLARIDGDWRRLVLDAKDDQLRAQVMELGVVARDWETIILPAIHNVRRYQGEQRQRLAEAERQAKLPPPHLFIATRDRRLLVRGELATLAYKRELLNALIDAFPEWRVLDDLRVNPKRRAVGELGPITAALLPPEKSDDPKLAGKALMLGLPGAAWQPVDWLVGGDASPWRELLPKDLPPELVQEDSRMVVEWLQGSAKGIPMLPIRLQPSFVTLTLLPDKVILAGQVAEEASRTLLIESARQKYAGRALVLAENLLARGTCEPARDMQQTLRSLPDLPEAGGAGALAFAKPGQVWKNITAEEKLAVAGAIATSGLLPQDFPAAMAEDTFLEGFDHLRHHWKKLAEGAKKEAAP